MKIEVGKYYKTRLGYKVKIYEIIDGYVIGAYFGGGEWWAERWDIGGNRIHIPTTYGDDYDIVSEWQEPLDFDWSCLPKWTDRWIAMDSIEEWCVYDTKPALHDFNWDNDHGYCFLISEDYSPKNFTGDWE